MTDVQQVEPSRKPPKKRAQKQPVALPHFDDKDVAKGKKLAATLKSKGTTLKSTQAAIKSTERELGELADRLKPIYGKQTLARFAKKIGLSADRLNRCRSVYRSWKNKEIKGPSPKFGVLQALAAHPAKDEIIKERPDLTVREARTLMRDYRKAQGKEQDWRVEETRRLLGEAKKHALDAHKKYGHPAQEHLDPNILRQAVDEPDKLVTTLRLGGQALNTLADEVEGALTTPPALPPPMFDDTPGNATPDQTT